MFQNKKVNTAQGMEKGSLPYLEARNRSARMNVLLILAMTLVNIFLIFGDSQLYYLFSALLPYWLVGFGYYNHVMILMIAGGVILALYLVFFLLWNKHPAFSIASLVLFVIDCIFLVWFCLGEPLEDNLMDIVFHIAVLAYLAYGVYITVSLHKKRKAKAVPQQTAQGPEF